MNYSPDHDSKMNKNQASYWYAFWNHHNNVCTGCAQKDVGRSRKGIPVTEKFWRQTIEYISGIIGLKRQDTLLELCCGNALILGPLAKRCAKSIGVDFSPILLKQAHELFPNVFETICDDVLNVELPENSTDVILLYFAIQHFDQKNAVRLIEKAIKLLKPGGRLLVGDVPDASKLWQYLNKLKYRRDYIQRILDDRPMIGTWFDRKFFEAIGEYTQNVDVKIIKQPEFLINSNYRYDVLYTKKCDLHECRNHTKKIVRKMKNRPNFL